MRIILIPVAAALVALPAVAQQRGGQSVPTYQQPGVLQPLFPSPPHPGLLQPPAATPAPAPLYQPPAGPTPGQRLPPPSPGTNTQPPNGTTYGLAPPPQGYTWVRRGLDAVLQNKQTGAVQRVRHNAF